MDYFDMLFLYMNLLKNLKLREWGLGLGQHLLMV